MCDIIRGKEFNMYLSRTTCDTIEKEIAREKYKVVRDYKVSSYWNDPAQQWDNPELRAETIARLNKKNAR